MALILHLLVFGLPLIVLPFGTSYFEIPKVILAEVCIIVITIFFIWKKSNLKMTIRKHWLLMAFFLLTLTQLLFVQTTSFAGNAFRLQGVFQLWMLLLLAYITSHVNYKQVHPLIPLGTIAALLFGSLLLPFNASGRAYSTVGEPNSLAAAAVFCFPFIWFFKNKYSHFIRVIAALLVFIIIVLTKSDSALIAFVLEIFLFITTNIVWSTKHVTFISIILMSISLCFPFFDEARIYENRGEIWYTAIVSGWNNPFIGWGVGGIEQGLLWGSHELQNNLRYQYVDSAHNILLDWWVQGGIVGVALFIALIWQVISSYVKHRDTFYLASFLSILTVLMFNPVSISILVPFWWLAGKSYVKDM